MTQYSTGTERENYISLTEYKETGRELAWQITKGKEESLLNTI